MEDHKATGHKFYLPNKEEIEEKMRAYFWLVLSFSRTHLTQKTN